ncbi:MAG TPA: protein kinase [Polyangiaceae bacterium]
MASFDVGAVILGKYEITRVLGRGGMGVVVAARHRELGELVALKFLQPALAADPASAARFLREARIATRIKNEHVARVYDVGTDGGAPFIVMEYLTGRDLAAEIRERGPLPVARAVDLLLQACEAIADAHQLGVVHRDLKPANLYVTTGSDGMPFVKVLDFGISKSMAGGDASVTASAAAVGTPLYMSPEQLAASKHVDARSDVWSLGVILYEMLAGATPFPGDSIGTVAAGVLRGLYTRLPAQRADVAEELDEAVGAALTRDLERRLPGVAAFAKRIAPFGSDAARASLDRIERIAARAAPPPGADATVADAPPSAVRDAAVPPATAATTSAPTAQSIGEVREAPPPRSRRRRFVAVAATAALAAASVATYAGVRAARSRVPAQHASSAVAAASSAPVCPLADRDKGNLCKECRNDNCCAAMLACDASSACGDYLACTRACTQQASCRDTCVRRFPEGHAVAAPYLGCLNTRCMADCAGQGRSAECSKCVLASCPDQMIRCTSDPACDAQYACETACSAHDDACKQRCRKEQSGQTQKMLDDFVLCGARYCEEACK